VRRRAARGKLARMLWIRSTPRLWAQAFFFEDDFAWPMELSRRPQCQGDRPKSGRDGRRSGSSAVRRVLKTATHSTARASPRHLLRRRGADRRQNAMLWLSVACLVSAPPFGGMRGAWFVRWRPHGRLPRLRQGQLWPAIRAASTTSSKTSRSKANHMALSLDRFAAALVSRTKSEAFSYSVAHELRSSPWESFRLGTHSWRTSATRSTLARGFVNRLCAAADRIRSSRRLVALSRVIRAGFSAEAETCPKWAARS